MVLTSLLRYLRVVLLTFFVIWPESCTLFLTDHVVGNSHVLPSVWVPSSTLPNGCKFEDPDLFNPNPRRLKYCSGMMREIL